VGQWIHVKLAHETASYFKTAVLSVHIQNVELLYIDYNLLAMNLSCSHTEESDVPTWNENCSCLPILPFFGINIHLVKTTNNPSSFGSAIFIFWCEWLYYILAWPCSHHFLFFTLFFFDGSFFLTLQYIVVVALSRESPEMSLCAIPSFIPLHLSTPYIPQHIIIVTPTTN